MPSRRKYDFMDIGFNTDVHSHILPGVDDGSQSMDDSIAIIRTLREAGVTRFTLTPHVSCGLYPNSSQSLRARFAAFLAALPSDLRTGANFQLAAEYMIDEYLTDLIAQASAQTSCNSGLTSTGGVNGRTTERGSNGGTSEMGLNGGTSERDSNGWTSERDSNGRASEMGSNGWTSERGSNGWTSEMGSNGWASERGSGGSAIEGSSQGASGEVLNGYSNGRTSEMTSGGSEFEGSSQGASVDILSGTFNGRTTEMTSGCSEFEGSSSNASGNVLSGPFNKATTSMGSGSSNGEPEGEPFCGPLTFPDGSILIEMSYLTRSYQLLDTVFDLVQEGYKPILAHPERYAFYFGEGQQKAFPAFWSGSGLRRLGDRFGIPMPNPVSSLPELEKLIDMGCRLQLNLQSLTGCYGPASLDNLKYLLDHDLYTFVATDIHSPQQFSNFKDFALTPSQLEKLRALAANNLTLFE